MVPFLIGNIFQEIYNLTDSIIVSQLLGVDAFAGVECACTAMKIFTEFILGISSGFVVVLSQEFGAKNETGARKCIATSMLVVFVMSIILAAVGIFSSESILTITETPQEAFGHALEFMLVSCAGLPLMMAYNFFSGIAKALGDSKISLYFLVLTAMLNVGFDYFNVAVLNLGVCGVAFATAVSQGMSSILCALYIYKKYGFLMPSLRNKQNFNRFYAKKFLKIALPISSNFVIGALGPVFLQTSINDLGIDAVTGYSIARKIDNVLTLTFLALGSAITTYTAQNFGAKKIKRIAEGVRANIVIGMTFCVIFGAVICLFWDQLVGLFVSEQELGARQAALQYVQIAISAWPAYCLVITFRNIVQALGKTVATIFADGLGIFVRSVGSMVLTFLLGYTGACLSLVLSWYIPFLVVVSSYVFAINKLEKRFGCKNSL